MAAFREQPLPIKKCQYKYISWKINLKLINGDIWKKKQGISKKYLKDGFEKTGKH